MIDIKNIYKKREHVKIINFIIILQANNIINSPLKNKYEVK
jgi:hypothetical protein